MEKQKELKHTKIDEHKETCDNLLRIRNESVKYIEEEIQQIDESNVNDVDINDSSIFDDIAILNNYT